VNTSRVLVIEDDADGRQSVAEAIQEIGYQVVAVETGRRGIDEVTRGDFDVVLSDLVLPDVDGIEVLRHARRTNSDVPVLIMTAYGTVSSSVEALKAGAYDYVTKPLDLDDLQSKIRRAAETRRLRAEVVRLERTVHEHFGVPSIVAKSPAMLEVLRQIERVADTNATVLISGESGTGKELVARALHVHSRRTTQPFVAVNCGAFPETLLESELFGHEKGAFTGASGQRKGAFERADGGTLFLDEIGDAPPSVQVKLLRVIEDQQIVRLGGQSPFKVDARLVSASNRELGEMVAEGEFREDVYYRLNVVRIRIPPLRERREDIRPLADRFIAEACEQHGRYIGVVTPAFYERLEREDWPGNVRQLRNAIEAAVVMAQQPELDAAAAQPCDPRPSQDGWAIPSGATLAQVERAALTQSLHRFRGNRSLSAQELGISRRTIQRKIKEHNLPF
jgi:two-component system response regulator HydG